MFNKQRKCSFKSRQKFVFMGSRTGSKNGVKLVGNIHKARFFLFHFGTKVGKKKQEKKGE